MDGPFLDWLAENELCSLEGLGVGDYELGVDHVDAGSRGCQQTQGFLFQRKEGRTRLHQSIKAIRILSYYKINSLI